MLMGCNGEYGLQGAISGRGRIDLGRGVGLPSNELTARCAAPEPYGS